MKIGYSRVSTEEQKMDLQNDALVKAGCDIFFSDEMSGAIAKREGLDKALAYARAGDVLVVWKLDRLGRSLANLIELITILKERNIEFISLTEQIDTSTPMGMLFFHLIGALAQFERDLIRERTNAGLAAARARGRVGGRKHKLNAKEIGLAQTLYDAKTPVLSIARQFDVSRTTLYKYLKKVPKQQEIVS